MVLITKMFCGLLASGTGTIDPVGIATPLSEPVLKLVEVEEVEEVEGMEAVVDGVEVVVMGV
jgi:hypothetical protein